jgi:hypothetical protein
MSLLARLLAFLHDVWTALWGKKALPAEAPMYPTAPTHDISANKTVVVQGGRYDLLSEMTLSQLRGQASHIPGSADMQAPELREALRVFYDTKDAQQTPPPVLLKGVLKALGTPQTPAEALYGEEPSSKPLDVGVKVMTLDSMSVAELRDMARALSIPNYAALDQDALISTIRGWRSTRVRIPAPVWLPVPVELPTPTEAPTATATPTAIHALDGLTRAQLRNLAEKAGVDAYMRMTKEQLRGALQRK